MWSGACLYGDPMTARVFLGGAVWVAWVFGLGAALWSAPQKPEEVGPEDLEKEPYRHGGFVRTWYRNSGKFVSGSGWVAGERVVATAGHVFFDREARGWNSQAALWRRAMPADRQTWLESMQTARTFRALAGYSDAAVRASSSSSLITDEFNVDGLALLFYSPATPYPAPARAIGQVEGEGTFSIFGYPATIAGEPQSRLAARAHGAGLSARFTREAASVDYAGRPMAVHWTPDLLSGPGASGGPLLRKTGAGWQVVGTLVGGAVDHSISVVRAHDSSLETLFTNAIADMAPTAPGQLRWTAEGVTWGEMPLTLQDGGVLVFLPSYRIGVLAPDGSFRWTSSPNGSHGSPWAETPSGKLASFGSSYIRMHSPQDGRELWSLRSDSLEGLAVGESDELYVVSGILYPFVSRVSPGGQEVWRVPLPPGGFDDPTLSFRRPSVAVAADGTVVVGSVNRVYGLDPKSGETRWKSDVLPGLHHRSLALSLDGDVLVVAERGLVRLSADGRVRWWVEGKFSGEVLTLRADGSALVATREVPALVLAVRSDGSEAWRFPLEFEGRSVSVDRTGGLYVVSEFGGHIVALDAQGKRLWQIPERASQAFLTAGGLLLVPGVRAIGAEAPLMDNAWTYPGGPGNGSRRVANSRPVAPVIAKLPTTAKAVAGTRFELEVTVEGSWPFTYVWKRNGESVPGATGSVLLLDPATAENAGRYSVTVTNRAGSAVSSEVDFRVDAARFGDRLWRSNLPTFGRPAIDDSGVTYTFVFISGVGRQLAALDLRGRELWRANVGDGSEGFMAKGPVVTDRGDILVAHEKGVQSYRSDGRLAWRWESPLWNPNYRPMLALTHDGGIYFSQHRSLTLLSDDGTVRWSRVLPDVSIGLFWVRRDNALLERPSTVVHANGVREILGPPRVDAMILGPEDEEVGLFGTVDRYGAWRATRDPDDRSFVPLLLMQSDGRMLDNYGRTLGLMGWSSEAYASGFSVTPVAILEGERVLGQRSDGVALLTSNGEVIAQVPHLDATLSEIVVGPKGQFVGGVPLAGYHLGLSEGNSPWPHALGDRRNTRRAPKVASFRSAGPRSVAILGSPLWKDNFPDRREWNEREVRIKAGYPAVLVAKVEGVGPYRLQWFKDGREVPGAIEPQLVFDPLNTNQAGEYVLRVVAGSVELRSPAFSVIAETPQQVVAGTYFREWQWSDGSGGGNIWLAVGADRTFEGLILSDGYLGSLEGSIGPGGELNPPWNWSARLNGATLTGSALGTEGSKSPVLRESTKVPSGVTAEGLRAGFYRGYTTGIGAQSVSALVFNDGSFQWTREGRTGSGRFALGSREARTEESWPSETIPFTLEARGTVLLGRSLDPAHDVTFVLRPVGSTVAERLVNVSTRATVSAQEPPLIAGVVLGGGGRSPLVIRAVGPGLTGFGVGGALARPEIRLVDGRGRELARNAAWSAGGVPALTSAFTRVGAFPLAAGSADAALLTTVDPGGYTVLLQPADGGAGVALAEIYEDPAGDRGGRITNLSTRGTVDHQGRSLIGGFVISGSLPKTVLIRAVGPGLDTLARGALDIAVDPTLTLYKSGSSEALDFNQDHLFARNFRRIRAESARVGAFSLPNTSRDAALLLSLEPGGYTAVVSNEDPRLGVVLLEIYEVPP